MSRISEARSRLRNLVGLGARMRGQIARLTGPAGEEIKGKVKESAKKIGIGVAIALFGLSVVAVAAVYVIAVVILLVNIALDRLWLSALIVVFGSFVLGGIVVFFGVATARKGAQEIPKVGGEVIEGIKSTGEEIKEAVEDLQEIARQEAEERQKQLQAVMQQAKAVAPYLIGAYVGYRLIRHVAKARRERLIRQIKELEEAG